MRQLLAKRYEKIPSSPLLENVSRQEKKKKKEKIKDKKEEEKEKKEEKQEGEKKDREEDKRGEKYKQSRDEIEEREKPSKQSQEKGKQSPEGDRDLGRSILTSQGTSDARWKSLDLSSSSSSSPSLTRTSNILEGDPRNGRKTLRPKKIEDRDMKKINRIQDLLNRFASNISAGNEREETPANRQPRIGSPTTPSAPRRLLQHSSAAASAAASAATAETNREDEKEEEEEEADFVRSSVPSPTNNNNNNRRASARKIPANTLLTSDDYVLSSALEETSEELKKSFHQDASSSSSPPRTPPLILLGSPRMHWRRSPPPEARRTPAATPSRSDARRAFDSSSSTPRPHAHIHGPASGTVMSNSFSAPSLPTQPQPQPASSGATVAAAFARMRQQPMLSRMMQQPATRADEQLEDEFANDDYTELVNFMENLTRGNEELRAPFGEAAPGRGVVAPALTTSSISSSDVMTTSTVSFDGRLEPLGGEVGVESNRPQPRPRTAARTTPHLQQHPSHHYPQQRLKHLQHPVHQSPRGRPSIPSDPPPQQPSPQQHPLHHPHQRPHFPQQQPRPIVPKIMDYMPPMNGIEEVADETMEPQRVTWPREGSRAGSEKNGEPDGAEQRQQQPRGEDAAPQSSSSSKLSHSHTIPARHPPPPSTTPEDHNYAVPITIPNPLYSAKFKTSFANSFVNVCANAPVNGANVLLQKRSRHSLDSKFSKPGAAGKSPLDIQSESKMRRGYSLSNTVIGETADGSSANQSSRQGSAPSVASQHNQHPKRGVNGRHSQTRVGKSEPILSGGDDDDGYEDRHSASAPRPSRGNDQVNKAEAAASSVASAAAVALVSAAAAPLGRQRRSPSTSSSERERGKQTPVETRLKCKKCRRSRNGSSARCKICGSSKTSPPKPGNEEVRIAGSKPEHSARLNTSLHESLNSHVRNPDSMMQTTSHHELMVHATSHIDPTMHANPHLDPMVHANLHHDQIVHATPHRAHSGPRMGVNAMRKKVENRGPQDYEIEIDHLHQRMRDMAAQQAQTIQLMEHHWQAKFSAQQTRMLQQQHEKDGQMRAIIERLSSVENQLRAEQSEMEKAMVVKQKIIESHEKKISSLDSANKRLLASLSQFKERFQTGPESSTPIQIRRKNEDPEIEEKVGKQQISRETTTTTTMTTTTMTTTTGVMSERRSSPLTPLIVEAGAFPTTPLESPASPTTGIPAPTNYEEV